MDLSMLAFVGAAIWGVIGLAAWIYTNRNVRGSAAKVIQAVGLPEGLTVMQVIETEMAKSAEMVAAKLAEALPGAAVQMWDALAPRLAEAMPSFAVAFRPALVEAAETFAPVLTDALVKHGAELMASKSNIAQSMAKAALNDVDLQQVLASPEVQALMKSAGAGGSPLASLGQAAGNPLAALMPRVMKYLPKDLQALAPLFLQGLGRGGMALGGNGGASSGSYSPGLPGRHR